MLENIHNQFRAIRGSMGLQAGTTPEQFDLALNTLSNPLLGRITDL
jgi:hypothetical protein